MAKEFEVERLEKLVASAIAYGRFMEVSRASLRSVPENLMDLMARAMGNVSSNLTIGLQESVTEWSNLIDAGDVDEIIDNAEVLAGKLIDGAFEP